MSYHDGLRHGAHFYVDLGRELNQVEQCLRTIGATAVVSPTNAAISADEMVKALRRATRAAEMLRYKIEHGGEQLKRDS